LNVVQMVGNSNIIDSGKDDIYYLPSQTRYDTEVTNLEA
jgi:hypothetical protein